MSESLPATDGQADEPLGIKSPLLPAAPLGQKMIQRQFLVPLGARSIAILDPSIFLQRSSDNFSFDLFEEPAFFPESTPPTVPVEVKRTLRKAELPQTQQSAVGSLDATIQPKLEELPEDSDINLIYETFEVQKSATSVTSAEPFIQTVIESDALNSTDSINSKFSDLAASESGGAADVLRTPSAPKPQSSHLTQNLEHRIQPGNQQRPKSETENTNTSDGGNTQRDDSRSTIEPESMEILAQRAIEPSSSQGKESTVAETNSGSKPPQNTDVQSSAKLEPSSNFLVQPSLEPINEPVSLPDNPGVQVSSLATIHDSLLHRSLEPSASSASASQNANIEDTALLESSNSSIDLAPLTPNTASAVRPQDATTPEPNQLETSSNSLIQSSSLTSSNPVLSSQDTDTQHIALSEASTNPLVQPSFGQVTPETSAESILTPENINTVSEDVLGVANSSPTSPSSNHTLSESNAHFLVQPSFEQVTSETSVESVPTSEEINTVGEDVLGVANILLVPPLADQTLLESNSKVSPDSRSADIQSASASETDSYSLVQPSFDLAASALNTEIAPVLEVMNAEIAMTTSDAPLKRSSSIVNSLNSELVPPVQAKELRSASAAETSTSSLTQASLGSTISEISTIETAECLERANNSSVQPFPSEPETELALFNGSEQVTTLGTSDVSSVQLSPDSALLETSSEATIASQNVEAETPVKSEEVTILGTTDTSSVQLSPDSALLETSSEATIVSQNLEAENSAKSEEVTILGTTDTSSVQLSADSALLETSSEATIVSQNLEAENSTKLEVPYSPLVKTINDQVSPKLSVKPMIDLAESLHLSQPSLEDTYAEDISSQNLGAENIAALEAPSNSSIQLSSDLTESEAIAKTEDLSQNTTGSFIFSSQPSDNLSVASSFEQISSASHSKSTVFQDVDMRDTSLEIPSISLAEPSSKPASLPQLSDAEDIATSDTSSNSLLQPSFEKILTEPNTETAFYPENADSQIATTPEASGNSSIQLSSSEALLESNPEVTSFAQNPAIQSLSTSEESIAASVEPSFDVSASGSATKSTNAMQFEEVESSAILETASNFLVQPSFDQASLDAETTIAPKPIETQNLAVLETPSHSNIARLSDELEIFRTSSSSKTWNSHPTQEFEVTDQPHFNSLVQLSSEQDLLDTETLIAPKPIQAENSTAFEASINSPVQLPFTSTSSESDRKPASPSQDTVLPGEITPEVSDTPSIQPSFSLIETVSSAQAVDATVELQNTDVKSILEISDASFIQPSLDRATSEPNAEIVRTPENIKADSSTTPDVPNYSLVEFSSNQVSPELSLTSSTPSQSSDIEKVSMSELSSSATVNRMLDNEAAIASQNTRTSDEIVSEVTQIPSPSDVAPSNTSKLVTPSEVTQNAEGLTVSKPARSPLLQSSTDLALQRSEFADSPQATGAEITSMLETTSAALIQSLPDVASLEPNTQSTPFFQEAEGTVAASETLVQAFPDQALSRLNLDPAASQTTNKDTIAMEVSSNSLVQLSSSDSKAELPQVQSFSNQVIPEADLEFTASQNTKNVAAEAPSNAPAQFSSSPTLSDLKAEPELLARSTDKDSISKTSSTSLSRSLSEQALAEVSIASQTVEMKDPATPSEPSIQASFNQSELDIEPVAIAQNTNVEGLEASSNPLVQTSFDQVPPQLNTESIPATQDADVGETSYNSLVQPLTNASLESNPEGLQNINNSSTQLSLNRSLQEPALESAIAPQEANVESFPLSPNSSNSLVQPFSDQAGSNAESISSSENSDPPSHPNISTEPFLSNIPVVESVSTIPSPPLFAQLSTMENAEQSHPSNLEETTAENLSVIPISDAQTTEVQSSLPEIQLLQSLDQDSASLLPQVLQNISILQPLTETPSTPAYPPVDFESSLAVIQRASDVNSQSIQASNHTASEWKPIVSQRKTSSVQRSLHPAELSRTTAQNHAIAKLPAIQAKYVSTSEPMKHTSQQDNSAISEHIETLAQAIYSQLKQRLRIDQERHGRSYSGRLPW